LASYLERLQRIQDGIVAIAMERDATADAVVTRARVAAAFGCLVAAQQAWLGAGASARSPTCWIGRWTQ